MLFRKRTLPPEVEDEVRERAVTLLAPGFNTEREVLDIVCDDVEEEHWRGARDVVFEESLRLLKRARRWPADEPKDHLRVEAAFDELAADGFVPRMNFTCCNQCGFTEIGDEREGSEWAFVFFHEQDTERLVDEPALLYLSFGAFDNTSEGDARAGAAVAEAMRRQGLEVDWDGNPEARIVLRDVRWRKRHRVR